MISTDRPTWVPDRLFPFQSRFCEIDGSRVHYIDEGAGPTLLFLHGNPTWSFLYRNIILGLRDGYRCVALDYPGFGLSSAAGDYPHTAAAHADVVERFVEKLDLDDITLVAHDWGGPIGLTVATRRPGRFKRFVLGNTWAWALNGTFHFELFGRIMGSPIFKLLIRRANVFVNVMIPSATTSRVPAEVMRAYREPFADPASRLPTWELPKELLRSERFLTRLEDQLPEISSRPALILWGKRDFALRRSVELPRLQRVFPDSETVIFDRAKHFFQEDAPQETVQAMRSWLTRHAGN